MNAECAYSSSTTQWPSMVHTIIGERGVRLSGGQRQRIGIARALYRDPPVLLFDETTSALDNATERAVMEAIHNLTGENMVILVAHRLSTVEPCDRIYVMANGRGVEQGNWEELSTADEQFQRLAAGGGYKVLDLLARQLSMDWICSVLPHAERISILTAAMRTSWSSLRMTRARHRRFSATSVLSRIWRNCFSDLLI